MKNNILITGGAGFIGSHFIKYLLEHETNEYHKIVILDKLTYASDMKRLANKLNKLIFVEGDICDVTIVSEIMDKYLINHIVNFAAESHVDRSILDESSFVQTNVFGVQNLMAVARHYWQKKETINTKFIQISTDEVYGSSSEFDQCFFDEDSKLSPNNPYSATKASAELLINAYVKTHKFPAIITRSSNNYGPMQNKEKFIPNIMTAIGEGRSIGIYGDGRNQRTWIHVLDNCRGIFDVLKHGKIGQAYNITSNQMLSNKDLALLIIKVYNSMAKKKYNIKLEYVEDRKGHDYAYRVDGSKMKFQLGFSSAIELEEGLRGLVEGEINM